MSDHLFWLTKNQFARLKPFLPDRVRGVARVDDRRVISGIVHVLRSGGRWVHAPAEYGPRKTLYNRFVRWAEKGIWRDIFVALADAGGLPSQTLIDSFAVRAHRSAVGGKGGTKAGDRTFARWSDDKNPRDHGSLVPTNPVHPDGRACDRLFGCRTSSSSAAVADQRCAGRQGLW